MYLAELTVIARVQFDGAMAWSRQARGHGEDERRTVMTKRRNTRRDQVLRKHVVKIRPGGFDIHVDSPPPAPDDPEHAEGPGVGQPRSDDEGSGRESGS